MLHNGYLVHPDIWMLWFSFIVAVLVVAKWLGILIGNILNGGQ